GLVAVVGIREEPLTHPAGERPVAAMDLDERLRVPGLEIQDEETVIQGSIAAQGVALVRSPDDHCYPPQSKNVGSTREVLEHRSRPGWTTVARSIGPPREAERLRDLAHGMRISGGCCPSPRGPRTLARPPRTGSSTLGSH